MLYTPELMHASAGLATVSVYLCVCVCVCVRVRAV